MKGVMRVLKDRLGLGTPIDQFVALSKTVFTNLVAEGEESLEDSSIKDHLTLEKGARRQV